MSKERESEADRIWKEKVDPTASREEVIVLLILLIAAGALAFVAGI
jgi:hypothetical protein